MIRLIKAKPDDADEIQRLSDSVPNFNLLVEGVKTIPNSGSSTLTDLPPNCTLEDKHVFFINSGEKNIGVIDLIIGYPKKGTAFLGLLFLDEDFQGQGLGRKSYELIVDFLADKNISCVELAVVESNKPAMMFWQKLGFKPAGRSKPFSGINNQSTAIVLSKNYNHS